MLFLFSLAKKENQVRKLKEDKSRLEAEVEQLEKKVERMSTMAKQVQQNLYRRTTQLCGLLRQVVFHYRESKHDFCKNRAWEMMKVTCYG